MSTKQWTALGVVLSLLGLTAVLLGKMGAVQRLGQPGLKLAAEPLHGTNGLVVRDQSVLLPKELSGYSSEPVEITELELNWLPQDTLFGRRQYWAQDGFRALASVVLMGSDRTSIHKPQFCLDGQGWKIDKTETVTIPMTRPHPYDLRVMKLTTSKVVLNEQGRKVPARGIYVYWFVADDLLTPHHGERMWWMARDLILTGVLQRWAYVTYFTVCPPGQEEVAYGRLKDLIAASVPEFQLTAGPGKADGKTTASLIQEFPNQKNN